MSQKAINEFIITEKDLDLSMDKFLTKFKENLLTSLSKKDAPHDLKNHAKTAIDRMNHTIKLRGLEDTSEKTETLREFIKRAPTYSSPDDQKTLIDSFREDLNAGAIHYNKILRPIFYRAEYIEIVTAKFNALFDSLEKKIDPQLANNHTSLINPPRGSHADAVSFRFSTQLGKS